jgi:hypothetical protein
MKARVPGLQMSELKKSLLEIEALLARFPELNDPRLHNAFWDRACIRWALEYPVESVIADLRSSALCLEGQASIRLFKLEHHRLKTRRIDPLHLAALHPDPEFVERFGSEYGLPLAAWYADAATAELTSELSVISGYFQRRTNRSGELDSPKQMTGLAAATYSAAFGYLAAGDEGSAAVVLQMLARQSNALLAAPPDAAKRYLRQSVALTAILQRDEDGLSNALKELLSDVKPGPRSPDLVIPALVGLAMLMNVEPDLGPLQEPDPLAWSIAVAVQEAWFAVE